MGQSVFTIDRQVSQGTAANGGGTFAPTYAVPTDKMVKLYAHCLVTRASASHLADCACLSAAYVAVNKNGTVTAPAALTNSTNPSNSNTTTFVASDAQASEYGGSGLVTLTWSVVGTDAVCTFTNVGNPSTVNVTIVIEAYIVGST